LHASGELAPPTRCACLAGANHSHFSAPGQAQPAFRLALGFGRAHPFARSTSLSRSPCTGPAPQALLLDPRKLSATSIFSEELAKHSTPAVEAPVRQTIAEDTDGVVDAALTGDAAASAIRSAGLLNGAAALSPDPDCHRAGW
jgi:hypothetical protein